MRLNQFPELVSSGGCAAKVGSLALTDLLSNLDAGETPYQLLVGLRERDDAAVWELDKERALILTVDFSPPVVADAYYAGALAVANALNDIYATGGQPLLCLNILGVSPQVDQSWTKAMLEGAMQRVHAAGAIIVGGHTINSPEPLYGLAVVGLASPQHVWKLSGAQPGDAIILTKPIGSGALFAATRGDESLLPILSESLDQMISLHRRAVEALLRLGVHAATDVSGFGLAGHLIELARASNVDIELHSERLPLYSGVRRLLQAGWTTRITDCNWNANADDILVDDAVDPLLKAALFDPQTAGGLLFAVDSCDADSIVRQLHKSECPKAAIIGFVGGAKGVNTRLLTVKATL